MHKWFFNIFLKKLKEGYFKVIAMHCITCKSIIKKQLKDENGFKRISVGYMKDSVTVEYDSALINKEIKERLENQGYKFKWLAKLMKTILVLSLYIKMNATIICIFFKIKRIRYPSIIASMIIAGIIWTFARC